MVQDDNHESTKEFEKTIVGLKIQVEEAKRIEEVLTSQLKEKEEICQERELEIVLLRQELENIKNKEKDYERIDE